MAETMIEIPDPRSVHWGEHSPVQEECSPVEGYFQAGGEQTTQDPDSQTLGTPLHNVSRESPATISPGIQLIEDPDFKRIGIPDPELNNFDMVQPKNGPERFPLYNREYVGTQSGHSQDARIKTDTGAPEENIFSGRQSKGPFIFGTGARPKTNTRFRTTPIGTNRPFPSPTVEGGSSSEFMSYRPPQTPWGCGINESAGAAKLTKPNSGTPVGPSRPDLNRYNECGQIGGKRLPAQFPPPMPTQWGWAPGHKGFSPSIPIRTGHPVVGQHPHNVYYINYPAPEYPGTRRAIPDTGDIVYLPTDYGAPTRAARVFRDTPQSYPRDSSTPLIPSNTEIGDGNQHQFGTPGMVTSPIRTPSAPATQREAQVTSTGEAGGPEYIRPNPDLPGNNEEPSAALGLHNIREAILNVLRESFGPEVQQNGTCNLTPGSGQRVREKVTTNIQATRQEPEASTPPAISQQLPPETPLTPRDVREIVAAMPVGTPNTQMGTRGFAPSAGFEHRPFPGPGMQPAPLNGLHVSPAPRGPDPRKQYIKLAWYNGGTK